MPTFSSIVLGVVGYAAVMTGLFWFAFLQRKKRREGRFPVPEDVRAMRLPGEQLSADLLRLDDRFDNAFLMLMGLPLLGTGLTFGLLSWLGLTREPALLMLGSGVVLAVAAVIFSIQKMMRTVEEIRDKRLALYGERVVADRLTELTADGFAVFHDVPCLGGSGRFNLDHVVVGRGGVGVVETKTYRKRAGVNGKDHEVSYDGQKLVWPNGTTTHELKQVMDGAEWLHRELKKHLNLDVPVRAALTMPGWYVKSDHSPKWPVLVANMKVLPGFIRERFQGKLTREQEDLVRRHLRGLCETVSFAEMSV